MNTGNKIIFTSLIISLSLILISAALRHIIGQPIVITSYDSDLLTVLIVGAAVASILVFSILTSRFVSEKLGVYEALRQNEERLFRTIKSIGDAVITLDTRGRIIYLNNRAEEMTGWKRKTARKRNVNEVFDISHIDGGGKIHIDVKKIEKYGDSNNCGKNVQIASRTGEIRYIESSCSPVLSKSGNISGYVIVFRDSTKKKKAELELKSSESKFRTLFEKNSDQIFITSFNDRKIIDVNQMFCDFLGRKKEEFIGKTLTELNIEIDQDDRQTGFETVKEYGELNGMITRIDFNDRVYFLSINSSLIDLDGKKCIITFAKDVTELKLAEDNLKKAHSELEERVRERTVELAGKNEELRAEILEREKVDIALRTSEKKYRSLLFQLPVGVYRTTFDGTFIEYNPGLEKILGLSAGDDLSKYSVYDFYIEEKDRQRLIEKQKNAKDIIVLEVKLKRLDGKRIWVYDRASAILNKDGDVEFFDGILEDITDRKETELALKESEQRYRNLFENLRDIFFRVTVDGRISLISPSVSFITGYSVDMLIGKDIRQFLSGDYNTRDFLKELNRTGSLTGFVISMINKDNNKVHLSVNAQYYKSEDGKIAGIEGIARDVSNETIAGNTLSALYNISYAINSSDTLDELYKSIHKSLGNIIDTSNFFIGLYDEKQRKISFPYLVDEKDDYIEEIDIDANGSLSAIVLRKGEPMLISSYEIKSIVKNADKIYGTLPLIWIAVPLKLKDETIGILGLQSYSDPDLYKESDIALLRSVSDQIALAIDRKRAALNLKFQIEFFQTLINTIPSPIFYKDAEGSKYLGCNKSFEEYFGFSNSEIVGKTSFDIMDKEIAQIHEKKDNFLLEKGGIQKYETEFVHSDGSKRYVVNYKSCYLDNDGNVAGIVGVFMDITGRVKAQEDSILARERAELIYNITPSCIFTVDNNYNITSWNKRIASITGYSEEEAIGKNSSMLSANMPDELYLFLTDKNKKPLYGVESTIRTKNEKLRVVSKNFEFLKGRSGDNKGAIISFEDITGRKRIEEALYWQAGANSAIADLSKAIISLASLSEISQLVLTHTSSLTGSKYGFVGYIDQNTGNLVITAHTDSSKFKTNGQKTTLSIDEYDPFWSRVIKDHEIIITNDIQNETGFHQNGTELSGIKKLIATPAVSGNEIMGVVAVANASRDYNDQDLEIVERMASLFAISYQRIKAEKEMRTALEKEQELSELKSRFILMVSHEYRTPLSAIMLSSELLQDYAEKMSFEEQRKHFERIQQSIVTMTKLLDDIITFNKVDIGAIKFDPAFITIKSFSMSLAYEVKMINRDRCEINVSFKGDDIEVFVDEKLLRQILTNLLSNAIKYSHEGSYVDLNIKIDEKNINFEVRDYGIGIPIDDQKNIFQPFHRASNVGTISGTGLGLRIVKNCVELHSGSIEFESQIGVGTSFVVAIPYKESRIPEFSYT